MLSKTTAIVIMNAVVLGRHTMVICNFYKMLFFKVLLYPLFIWVHKILMLVNLNATYSVKSKPDRHKIFDLSQ
jgi:uncharacterized membrane protein